MSLPDCVIQAGSAPIAIGEERYEPEDEVVENMIEVF